MESEAYPNEARALTMEDAMSRPGARNGGRYPESLEGTRGPVGPEVTEGPEGMTVRRNNDER